MWPFRNEIHNDKQTVIDEVNGLSSPSFVPNLAIAGLIDMLRPVGPGVSDHNVLERCINVITSLPYAAVGLHAMTNRKTAEGKLWGASLVGVSAGAVAFHASSGEARNFTRKLDYWLIAVSSCLLSCAVFPEKPLQFTLLGLALTPFQPFSVSATNIAAMEVEFLRRARAAGGDSQLSKTQRRHLASSTIGAACFWIEDHNPHIPAIHAIWHILSTYSTASTNCLLASIEKEHGLL